MNQENGRMIELVEKPIESYLCNAGFYALNSSLLGEIPKETFWNMTDLIDILNKLVSNTILLDT